MSFVLDGKSMERTLSVPTKTIPMQEGRTAEAAEWDDETMGRAIRLLDNLDLPEGSELFVSTSGAPWVNVAFREALADRFQAKFLFGPTPEDATLVRLLASETGPYWTQEKAPPKGDGPAFPFPTDADINITPPFGTPDPEFVVRFTLLEEQEAVYIDCDTDEPDSPVHTFDIHDLGRIVLPEIPEGRDLFLHVEGRGPVQWCIGHGFAQRCRSLSMCTHDEAQYSCVVSRTAALVPGQKTPRKYFIGGAIKKFCS